MTLAGKMLQASFPTDTDPFAMLNAHDVPCSICGVSAGQPCLYEDGTECEDVSHAWRLVTLLKRDRAKSSTNEKDESSDELDGWSLSIRA
jgi:hypothetical protein